MSEIPVDLRFLKSHEWVRVLDDGTIRVGISEHAQSQLGDLVYVDLPKEGAEVNAGVGCAVVESVKTASDIYAPVSGKIIAINEALRDRPETINEDAFGEGWIFAMAPSNPDELSALLDAEAYADLLKDQDH